MNRLAVFTVITLCLTASARAGEADPTPTKTVRKANPLDPETSSGAPGSPGASQDNGAALELARRAESDQRKKQLLSISKQTKPDDVLKQLRSAAPSMLMESQAGKAQSAAEEAVAETLQVLGQIVADRASAKAYALIKTKLEAALACSGAGTLFPATCQVLKPLRIQELATSGDALQAALLSDIVTDLSGQTAFTPEFMHILQSDVLPLVLHRREITPQAIAVLVQDIVGVGIRAAVKDGTVSFCAAERYTRSLTLASLALLQCKAAVKAGENRASIVDCELGLLVDQLADGAKCDHDHRLSDDERVIAHVFGSNLLAALTASPTTRPGTVRAEHALTVFLDTACVKREQKLCAESATNFAKAMLLTRDGIFAILERDSNALIAVGWKALPLAERAIPSGAGRGLQVMGALIQYTETYGAAGKTDANATLVNDAHERRTKILESLTQEMTNRTGREEDSIWSLGGSLRASGGIRTMRGETAFFGPLSLPLGLAFQGKGTIGFHLELSPVDLGQYLSFDSGFKVAKPNVADALAPSVTTGIFFDKSFPIFLGISLGFSPQYRFTENGRRGAFSVGLVAGVYVPLLDVN